MCRIARHGKGKRCFGLGSLTAGGKLQSRCRCLPGFCGIAVSSLPLSGNRLPYCPIFLTASPNGRVHSPPGQFPRLAQMTRIRLGVGCEREPDVLVLGLAREPALLFRHRGGVRPEKGKSIESIVRYRIVQFSRLRLVNDLPCLVEALQGKTVVGEIRVQIYKTRREGQGLAGDLRGFVILPLFGVHPAQSIVRFPGVACSFLLIDLERFVQFPGYEPIVAGGDRQPFPFTGMIPQLERLGVVLAGPPLFTESNVDVAHSPVAHGEIRIKLDGPLRLI